MLHRLAVGILIVILATAALATSPHLENQDYGSTKSITVPPGLGGRLLMKTADGLAELDMTSGRIRELANCNYGYVSPDGKSIVYQRIIASDAVEIYVMDANGSNSRHITTITGYWVRLAGWTPSGERLIFGRSPFGVGWCFLYSIALDGSDEQLFLDPVIADGNDQNVYGIAFSADGGTIYWASQDGIWSPTLEIYKAYMVGDQIDAGTVVQLTSNSVYDDLAYSSVAGGRIAFHRAVGHDYDDEYWEIYIMDADGSNQVQLTSNSYRDDHALLSPDGSTLLWGSYATGESDIMGMALPAGTPFTLVDGDGHDTPLHWVADPINPLLLRIADLGNDQGRQVRISFGRCVADVPGSDTPVIQYEFFRRIDGLKSGAGFTERAALARELGMLSGPAKLAVGWDYAGAVPAHGETWYNAIMPTLADSTDAGIGWSVFFIRAATAQPTVFFDSAVDSGYSVDNLSPPAPSGLLVVYSVEHNSLSWNAVEVDDLELYRVYRGEMPGFDPQDADVFETYSPEYVDDVTNGWQYHYMVRAVDYSGNESSPATPAGIAGVDSPPAADVVLELRSYPNPFNPSTTLSYRLPAAGHVTLRVYDLRGRLVRALVDEYTPAGQHEVVWTGDDAAGRQVASGVYLALLQSRGNIQRLRLALVE